MEIYIFSNSAVVKKAFSGFSGAKGPSVKFFPVEELKKTIKQITPGSMIYVDAAELQMKEFQTTVKFLAKLGNLRWGIIDPKGNVSDIADIFFCGASDYIGKNLIEEKINPSRLQKIFRFKDLAEVADESQKASIARKYALSGNDWTKIKTGSEYTFCLMHFEMDNQSELKSLLSGNQRNIFIKNFHDFLESEVNTVNGKIWMWMDFSGLILFPFDGKTCDAITTCFKLILNRRLISKEVANMDYLLSYHISLHLGNTIYKKRGDTGTIVSDSINSIFHLGNQYAKAGNFYLTEDIANYIPKCLEPYFIPEGEFEGRKIFRMRLPI
jgi:hypothetical protein